MSRHWFEARPNTNRCALGSAPGVGKWLSVHRQFRRGTLAGLWEDVLDALNHAGSVPDRLQMIDSTVIRARHHAAAQKGAPEGAVGRSRGGFRTRIHFRVNNAGLPMRTGITPGQGSDYAGYDPVMADNLPSPAVLVADKGYNSEKSGKMSRNATPSDDPDAQDPQGPKDRGHEHVHPAQHGGTLLQHAEEHTQARDTLRQNRKQLSRLHRHRMCQNVPPPCVDIT